MLSESLIFWFSSFAVGPSSVFKSEIIDQKMTRLLILPHIIESVILKLITLSTES